MVGTATLAGIAALFLLHKRASGGCSPWLLLYGSVGAGLVMYAILKMLFW